MNDSENRGLEMRRSPIDGTPYLTTKGAPEAAAPALSDQDIIDAVNGLCWAASRMNLRTFCQTLGFEEDDYALEKFRELQQAARLLGRFDNTTLVKLAKAGRS